MYSFAAFYKTRKGIFECILTASKEFLPHSEEYIVLPTQATDLIPKFCFYIWPTHSQAGARMPLICAQLGFAI